MTAMAKRADARKCKPKQTKYNRADIVEGILNGKTLKVISLEYGVTLQAVQQWLLRNHPQDYQLVQDVVADNMADEMLEVAYSTDIEVPRARNIINSIQFRLQRRHANLYGDKQEVTHKDKSKVQPIINVFLASPDATVAIDGEVIDAKALPSNDKDAA